MIERLVLFGATGDLAGRFLLPALASLHAAGRLPEGFRSSPRLARTWTTGGSGAGRQERLERHASGAAPAAREAIVRSLRYRQASTSPTRRPWSGGRAGRDEPVAVYLALPPARVPDAVSALGAVGLAAGGRVALEKPFGEDLRSAVGLNRLLAEVGGTGAARIPRRPRPRHGDGAEPARDAPREPRPRSGVERRPRRSGGDPLGGDARARGPGRILRPRGRAEGRDAEPHAAAPLPGRDGAASRPRRTRAARPQGRRPALGPARGGRATSRAPAIRATQTKRCTTRAWIRRGARRRSPRS